MDFKCSSCGNSYDVTEEHAGMEFECSNCQAAVAVPENLFSIQQPSPAVEIEQPDPSPVDSVKQSSDRCPKCAAFLKANAMICVECGHNLKLGVNVKTVAKAKKAGSFGIALGIASATALVSALIWAGIAIAINMEIGYVAWGIGIAVGGSVILLTDERSMRLGLAAVLLSVFAIMFGKLLYANYGLDSAIKSEIKKDPDAIAEILFMEMSDKGEFDQKYLDWLEKHEDPFEEIKTAPDEMKVVFQTNFEKFAAKLNNLTPEEKERLYESGTDIVLGSISYTERIKATCSFWDILWLGLAVSSAWKMAAGHSDDS